MSRSAPAGDRVKILSMKDGSPFDPAKTYKVAMTSYRANGGGDLLTEGAGIDPTQMKVLEKYKDIRSIIGDYIAGQEEIVPEVSTNWKFVK